MSFTLHQIATGQANVGFRLGAMAGTLADRLPGVSSQETFDGTMGTALGTATTACAGADPIRCLAEFYTRLVSALDAEGIRRWQDYQGNRTPELASLTLSPTSVLGGTANSTGTVTLNHACPPAGITVTLASDDTDAATVPGTLSFTEGNISKTFTVTSVAAPNPEVTITASYNSVDVTAVLAVTG